MKFTEVSEMRFDRAMERLFSGSSTPADSSVGVSSPAEKKKEIQQSMSGRALQTAGLVAPLPASHVCRPWDRGDLLRRLATYKSISWFGKPQVAGPVACARKGWVNVDIDLLACEACGSRVCFPVPPSWPRHQVEQAALSFAEQLDNAHKALCTWRNNPCAEMLAHFPPTPMAVLRRAYFDRCEALLQLSGLPVISETAKYQMKLSRGPQVDHLLSEPSHSDPVFQFGNRTSSSASGIGFLEKNKCYYEAQRMIAVCGWEPRLVPYTVDCEGRSGAQFINEQAGTSQAPGPSFSIHLKGNLEAKVAQSQIQPNADASDPASAVLDCNLCGASVGLWNFTTVNRPAPILASGLEEISSPVIYLESHGVRFGADDLVEDLGLAMTGAADALGINALKAEPVNLLERAAPQKGALDLKLTIAGGPPPTRHSAPILAPDVLHTGIQPKRSEASVYAAASYESRISRQQERTAYGGRFLETIPYDRSLPEVNVEGKLVDDKEMENMEGSKDAGCWVKQMQENFIIGKEQAEGDLSFRNSKRKREVGSQWPGRPIKQAARDVPHASSVNANDTCCAQKQENSMESVDNLAPDSDKQCATTAVYHWNGLESVVQTDYSMCPQYGIEAVKRKCGGEVEEGLRTDTVVISSGTETSAGIGGCGRVGIGGSFEVEIQGAGAHLERSESVAKFSTAVSELMEELVSDHGLMDDFVPEEAEKLDFKDFHRGSQQSLLDINATKLEIRTGEFDPICHHRHFCPWVNGNLATATSSTDTGICGWQIMLDAFQHEHCVPGLAKSEFARFQQKGDPLLSVRKFLGCISSNQLPRT